MRLAKSIGKHLNDGGEILLSGIIDPRLDEVVKCYEAAGFKVVKRKNLDEWNALLIKRA